MDGRNLNKNLDALEPFLDDDAPLSDQNAHDDADFDDEMQDEMDEDYDDAPISFYAEDVEPPLTEAQTEDFEAWITGVVAAEKREINAITFIFCSDEYLLNINKEFLAHDYYTDVITFPYHESETEALEGDIYISAERTAENAKTAGVSHLHEIARIVVHGVLHLCGYDDATDELRAAMREKENFYLGILGVK
jgi:probable rRNA maturation factor